MRVKVFFLMNNEIGKVLIDKGISVCFNQILR